MALDQTATFGGLAILGFGAVSMSLRNIRAELKVMILESDDFRESAKSIAEDAIKGLACKEEVAGLKARVQTLEAQSGYKLKETGAFPKGQA